MSQVMSLSSTEMSTLSPLCTEAASSTATGGAAGSLKVTVAPKMSLVTTCGDTPWERAVSKGRMPQNGKSSAGCAAAWLPGCAATMTPSVTHGPTTFGTSTSTPGPSG